MSLRYKIPSYQNIFDALISISVPLDSIVETLKNSNLELDTDYSVISGTVLYEISQVSATKGGQTVIKPSTGISKYTTNSTQNIFDVCLMTNTDINKIVLLISQNTTHFNSINSKVAGVLSVNFNDSDVTDNGFKAAVRRAKINFTTGDVVDDSENFLLQENGYYILQENGFALLY